MKKKDIHAKKRLAFLIGGIICLFLLFQYVKKDFKYNLHNSHDMYNENVTKKDKTETLVVIHNNNSISSTSVTKILKQIDNDNIKDAIKSISALESVKKTSTNYLSMEYLFRFRQYEKKPEKIAVKEFFTGMQNMQNFLKTECVLDDLNAEEFAQVIPFYILKTTEKKTKNTGELCKLFLENDIKDQHLSKKGAIVLCLAIRTQYERYGKTSQQLKDIQEKIAIYQQKYQSELGNEPKNQKYIDEINYIDSFNQFLTERINKPENFFLKMGHFFSGKTFNDKIVGLGE